MISLVSANSLPPAIVTASTKKFGMSFFATAISSTTDFPVNLMIRGFR